MIDCVWLKTGSLLGVGVVFGATGTGGIFWDVGCGHVCGFCWDMGGKVARK